MQATNGAAELVFTNAGEDLAVDLSGGPYAASAGVVFYFGFNLSLTTLPSSDGNYFLHLKDSATNTTFRAKVFASTTNAAAGLFRLGIAGCRQAASTPNSRRT